MIGGLGRASSKTLGPGDLAPLDPLDLNTHPLALADAMPDLLVEAKKLAASLVAGLHGRRSAGTGQSFWQYRPYGPGDPSARIDWRRSARGDQLFVREMEWESAHTVRLSVDMSASMRFASPDAREPKRDRAILMALALASMLTRSGERVGLIGGERPRTGAAALSTMTRELVLRDTDKTGRQRWLDMAGVRPREDVVIFSDFLFDRDERKRLIDQLSARGARAHLVQIIDPVEEAFPFRGRTRFEPASRHETPILSGRAESWQQPYKTLFRAFCEELKDLARSRGWSHTQSHTDRTAATPMLALHEALARVRDR